jgi:hypothetical protein
VPSSHEAKIVAGSALRRLLSAREQAARKGGRLESADIDRAAADLLPADTILARVEDIMRRMPPDEIEDPVAFGTALDVVLREGEKAIKLLHSDPGLPIHDRQRAAMEAVIRTDGTRPSLLVRDGRIDPDHPLADAWRDELRQRSDLIAECAAATGRIASSAPGARSFFGTGFLVDAAVGLALTNLHVLEAINEDLPTALEPTGNSFRVQGDVFIDFVGESNNAQTNRFRVVEATPSRVDGAEFARLDAALIRLEPTHPDQFLPEAVRVVADLDLALGNTPSFCLIGFPGSPPLMPADDGVDWGKIYTVLFGNRFGVKRVAPGQVHKKLGSIPEDERRWVFGHDATTLGGSSGSAVIDWLHGGATVGLHFSGLSLESNYAHDLGQCRASLEPLGVPYGEAR